MKKLLLILILLLLSCNDFAVQSINYDDSRIQYLGRWQDTGTGIWSAWPASQFVFKVSGASSIAIHVSVVDENSTDYCNMISIRDLTIRSTTSLTTAADVYTGAKTATITVPDKSLHTYIFKAQCSASSQYTGTAKITINSIDIDDGATLSSWKQGLRYIQTLGDSWMTGSDWPWRMTRDIWKLYPIAFGGMRVGQMDDYYNYKSVGVEATNDPVMDAVVISYGINDLLSNVTVKTYQASMLSLVDKVRAKQPTAHIFLLQVPKNVNTNNDYGQYGTAMQNITALRSKVCYIPTSSLENSIEWLPDNYHLTSASLTLFANYVDNIIQGYFTKLSNLDSDSKLSNPGTDAKIDNLK
jgi:hypothetical protein